MPRSLSLWLPSIMLAWTCASCGGRPVGGTDGASDRDIGRWDRRSTPRPERRLQLDRALPPKLDRSLKPDQPTPCTNDIGARCSTSSPCCSNLTCVNLDTGVSACSIACTPDDPATPLVNEDSCPDLSSRVCADVVPPAGKTYCLRRCAPTKGMATCPTGLACHPRSVRFTESLEMAVCAYPACTGPNDCPVYLAVACSPGSPSTCPGQSTGNFCAPDESSGGHRCAMPGACDAKSGLCLPHLVTKNVDVGGACTEDATCISQGICDIQRSSGGVMHARNGYCTIEGCTFSKTLLDAACPYGSTCQRLYPGGRCMKTCDLSKAGDCRGHSADKYGDYDCYAWNNMVSGSTLIATQPTCEPADNYPCSMFAPSKIDCTVLGVQSANPTQMQCRDRATGAILPNNSPAGLCLDLTASGP